jgi:pimeloyl-ACP methyl ester carboxylesterase
MRMRPGSAGIDQNRRQLLSATLMGIAAAGAASFLPRSSAPAAANETIRSFHINVAEEDLADLRRRVLATRWPDRETVADQSQGVQLDKIKELVRYWGTEYDWRKIEAKLNALPQFVTEIDGLDIYFIHVRSRHPNALPIIITHGRPGSVLELVKAIGPLADPTAFGGAADDAFDVVVPSMPGYGFSEKPKAPGWGPDRIARAWDVLMKRLGYQRYVSQGGDWGAVIAEAMARQAPAGLLGIHVNLPAAVPADVLKAIASGGAPPAGLSEVEKAAFDAVNDLFMKRRGYAVMMGTRPQTVGYGLTDSPVGLAAWMADYNSGEPLRSHQRRDSRRRCALLADEHGDFFSATLLGKQRYERRKCCGTEDERNLSPCWSDGVSGRDLSCAKELGSACLPQPELFQRGRQGRSLRGVGTA